MKNIIIIFILVLLSGCQKYQPNPIGTIINLMVKGTDDQKTIEKQEKQNIFYNQNFSKEMNVRKA